MLLHRRGNVTVVISENVFISLTFHLVPVSKPPVNHIIIDRCDALSDPQQCKYPDLLKNLGDFFVFWWNTGKIQLPFSVLN